MIKVPYIKSDEPHNSLKTNYQTAPEYFSSAPDNAPICYFVIA